MNLELLVLVDIHEIELFEFSHIFETSPLETPQ